MSLRLSVPCGMVPRERRSVACPMSSIRLMGLCILLSFTATHAVRAQATACDSAGAMAALATALRARVPKSETRLALYDGRRLIARQQLASAALLELLARQFGPNVARVPAPIDTSASELALGERASRYAVVWGIDSAIVTPDSAIIRAFTFVNDPARPCSHSVQDAKYYIVKSPLGWRVSNTHVESISDGACDKPGS